MKEYNSLNTRLTIIFILAIVPIIGVLWYLNFIGYQIFSFLVIILIVAFSAFVILYYANQRYIVQPVRDILDNLHKVQQGDFSVRTDINYGLGEIGELAKGVDQTVERLEKLYGSLESQVEERTSDLIETVDALEKQSALFESTINQMPVGVSVYSYPEGEVVSINTKGTELLGRGAEVEPQRGSYSSTYEVLNHKGEPYEESELPLVKTLETGKPAYANDLMIRKPNDEVIYAEVHSSPVKYNDEVVYVVVVFEDISEQVKLDKAKEQFISLSTHQLKTPLTAFNWNLESLGETRLTKKQKETYEQLKRINESMINLVDMFLNVSRAELGTLKIKTEEFAPKTVVENVLLEERKRIDEKNLNVEVDLEKSLKIETDKNIFKVIIQNLISNAVKYSFEGGSVHISCSEKDSKILCSVKDEGIGIPADQQGEIFEKMYRANNVGFTEGTGLGLYLSKQMIEILNGKIWLSSQEGKGTTFYFEIPKKHEEEKN